MADRIGDILRNGVKEKLARGEVVASMTVRLVRGVEIASIAKTAGFDALYVDVEHSSFSLDTASQICIAALAVGIVPFVRVPSHRPEHVSRALDGGALDPREAGRRPLRVLGQCPDGPRGLWLQRVGHDHRGRKGPRGTQPSQVRRRRGAGRGA